MHKYIAFNIFSGRILIISYKMLIISRMSNETRNELTIYEHYVETSEYFTYKK